MTGAEFYNYVIQIFKRSDKSDEVYEAITDTIKDMTKRHPFREMKVEAYTTAGITTDTDYRLELPVDFEHLLGDVKFINGTESDVLIKLSKGEFDERYPYLSDPDNREPGTPKYFCLWNNQILIAPIPDSRDYGYEISYCRKITSDITASSTSVELTENNREAVRSGTLARMFETMEDYEKAAYWHARHDRDLSIIMGLDTNNENVATSQEYNGV